jgi:hypothetical protein
MLEIEKAFNAEINELKHEIENHKSRINFLAEVPKLYYNYGKMKEDDIRKNLEKIKIVLRHSGKLYPITEELLKEVKEKPRNVSIQFVGKMQNQAIEGLKEYKKINYLVKSSSRFFLKPDIGEVFDQIHFEDLWGDDIKAICLEEGDLLLPGTEGEHFIMTATLLTI